MSSSISEVISSIPLSINQVEKITGVNKPTLRYWEKTFKDFLNPPRTEGKHRYYRQEDIEKVLRLKNLLLTEMFSIRGARRKLGME